MNSSRIRRTPPIALLLSFVTLGAIAFPLAVPVQAGRECFPFPDAQPQYCVVYNTSFLNIVTEEAVFHCWVHAEIYGGPTSYEALGQTGCQDNVSHLSVSLRLTRPPTQTVEEWGQCVPGLCTLAEARIDYPYSKCTDPEPDLDCSKGELTDNRHLILLPYEITEYTVWTDVEGDPLAECEPYTTAFGILCYTSASVNHP